MIALLDQMATQARKKRIPVTDLLWYVTKKAELRLREEFALYGNEAVLNHLTYDWVMFEMGVVPVTGTETHPYWVILGQQSTEWALGLTSDGRIVEAEYRA